MRESHFRYPRKHFMGESIIKGRKAPCIRKKQSSIKFLACVFQALQRNKGIRQPKIYHVWRRCGRNRQDAWRLDKINQRPLNEALSQKGERFLIQTRNRSSERTRRLSCRCSCHPSSCWHWDPSNRSCRRWHGCHPNPHYLLTLIHITGNWGLLLVRVYILSFLYFIREQTTFVIISSKDKQEVLSLSFITRYRYP